MLLLVLIAIVAVAFVVALGLGTGLLLGNVLRLGFGFPVRRSVDSVLARTRELLLNSIKVVKVEDAQKLRELAIELDAIDNQWNNAFITRVIRWASRGKSKTERGQV